MVRAVLDANVLISAAIRPSGPPGQILAALFARQAFELVLSPTIIVEVEKALRSRKMRRYLQKPAEALLFLADAVALADVVQDTGSVTGVCRDPDDDVVLAAAVEGRARVMVTGDDDLLTLDEYQGIAIVAPRVFLDLVKE
ncbi:MAG: putative toxin-antitoxin system toxin component, PIN family [Gammaproteobacteria bacterium]